MGKKDDISHEEIPTHDEYRLMERLESLETLREDMEDLGVSTLVEVIQQIEALHRQLDSTKGL